MSHGSTAHGSTTRDSTRTTPSTPARPAGGGQGYDLPEPPSKVDFSDAKTAGEIPRLQVTLRIRRYQPEVTEEAYWQDFSLTMIGTDRVLDALHVIKWDHDGTLVFRRSCAHGVCGSDAMRINGRNRLACKTLLKDLNLKEPVIVEPLQGLPIEKDLIVDMEPFFQSYREIMPFLITRDHEPARERLQSPEERERFDDTTKCILCAACTSSCPVFWTDGQYFGPAAIVNAHRFIFDSRDDGGDMRLEVLNDAQGVWRCRTVFNCSEACPRGIKITQAIKEVKRAVINRHV
jgi:succinate dehydrogenase / fumarate reductase iron-sulfur subunit